MKLLRSPSTWLWFRLPARLATSIRQAASSVLRVSRPVLFFRSTSRTNGIQSKSAVGSITSIRLEMWSFPCSSMEFAAFSAVAVTRNYCGGFCPVA